jgi:hypothetical protein
MKMVLTPVVLSLWCPLVLADNTLDLSRLRVYTMTFDKGTIVSSSNGQPTGYLEDGILATGKLDIRDVDGNGSKDITFSPDTGTVRFTLVAADPGPYGYGFAGAPNPAEFGVMQVQIGIPPATAISFYHASNRGPAFITIHRFPEAQFDWTQNAMWEFHGEPGHGGLMSLEYFQIIGIPEPSTYALMLGGLAAMGLWRRNRAHRN